MTGSDRAEGPRPTGEARPPRAVIENVSPSVDGGRFPAKRTVGERVVVEADAFAEGHDVLTVVLRWRPEGGAWTEQELVPLGNDRWRAEFTPAAPGPHRLQLEAWVDTWRTWEHGLEKKVRAGAVEPVDLLVGAALVEEAAGRAGGEDQARLRSAAAALRAEDDLAARARRAQGDELLAAMRRHPDRSHAARTAELPLLVERERARYGAWYELFPRSMSATPGEHGTLRDVEAKLPYVASMGFDVLYLPPIHPIGRAFRKGKNNATTAGPGDVGSPWAIGGPEGGHTAIHPELGTMADFRRLVSRAAEHGIELALDLAFQCSPDHPWVKEHPEWFRVRPDGTVQYAENPPKKYQDIYPIEFETDAWRELWAALLGVVRFWAREGVRIFRVDNPHTKPFRMWEWLIGEARREFPDLVFLSEAFTRPRVMYQLAKAGFSQSYTYFTWRNTKWELERYLEELTRGEPKDFFRPNFWPNTPDILPEPLQWGGRPMFQARLVLAATLAASYGIYGPAYELMESRPRVAGGEEYLDSEKYELKRWDLDRPDSLREFVARVNRIRRENPALHANGSLRFHRIENDQLVAYSKASDDGANVVLVVVNLDPHHRQSGFIELPASELGLAEQEPFQVHDLLGGGRYLWGGSRHYVEIDPHAAPAQIFRIRRRVRTEQDFDYFL